MIWTDAKVFQEADVDGVGTLLNYLANTTDGSDQS